MGTSGAVDPKLFISDLDLDRTCQVIMDPVPDSTLQADTDPDLDPICIPL